MAKRRGTGDNRPKKKSRRFDVIDPGWRGIFVTCPRGREGQARLEVMDWLREAADSLWPLLSTAADVSADDKSGDEPAKDTRRSVLETKSENVNRSIGNNNNKKDKNEHNNAGGSPADDNGNVSDLNNNSLERQCSKELSVEDKIKLELEELAQDNLPKSKNLIAYDSLGCECVLFIRTKAPIVPSLLVRQACKMALEDSSRGVRYVQRLCPVDALATVTADLEQIETKLGQVVKQEFASETPQKFAIRPTTRLNDSVDRDNVIKQVAKLVGPGHSVDLKNYDKMIIVECFKNVIGLAVSDSEYDKKFCRYNLMQINQKAQESGS